MWIETKKQKQKDKMNLSFLNKLKFSTILTNKLFYSNNLKNKIILNNKFNSFNSSLSSFNSSFSSSLSSSLSSSISSLNNLNSLIITRGYKNIKTKLKSRRAAVKRFIVTGITSFYYF